MANDLTDAGSSPDDPIDIAIALDQRLDLIIAEGEPINNVAFTLTELKVIQDALKFFI